MNPFASQTESEARWNLYRQGALAAIISRFPGVAKADVVVDAEQKFKVGVNTQPTGMVNHPPSSRAGAKAQDSPTRRERRVAARGGACATPDHR
jgi:hypothetical protein